VGASKEDILSGTPGDIATSPSILSIVHGEYRANKRAQIKSSGYVVHSLEAALWCFWRTKGFEEAVLVAVNLGDDADTGAAICGQGAGAHYGAGGIPQKWVERLGMRTEITVLADQLQASGVGLRK
jgi:ADP-ribosyl-[dinitrogen reductase] hydrolase